mmetsp:Transcript_25410/g.85368  ORF Transcript_25410/g.85368 Transcript_25410/m.85368 type:complete len:230 (+) Transcript_25410:196-885(+)
MGVEATGTAPIKRKHPGLLYLATNSGHLPWSKSIWTNFDRNASKAARLTKSKTMTDSARPSLSLRCDCDLTVARNAPKVAATSEGSLKTLIRSRVTDAKKIWPNRSASTVMMSDSDWPFCFLCSFSCLKNMPMCETAAKARSSVGSRPSIESTRFETVASLNAVSLVDNWSKECASAAVSVTVVKWRWPSAWRTASAAWAVWSKLTSARSDVTTKRKSVMVGSSRIIDD